MFKVPSTEQQELLLVEIECLRQQVDRLERENSDLQIALSTTAEHGDFVEAELQRANQSLQTEIAERQTAQAALQQILATVTKDKADLELILHTTAEHGDTVEYQLYTQAVEFMRESEELLRAIAESTPILMFLTQRDDGIIAYANSTASAQLGLDTKSLIGQHLRQFYANPIDEQQLQAQFSQQGHVRNYEMQVRRVDGTEFWVSASMHSLPLGSAHTLLTTFYDISFRKQAEAELLQAEAKLRQQAQELEQRVEQRTAELGQAEAKYRSIFENAIEGIFQATADGKFVSANPALAEIYGYSSTQAMINDVVDPGRQYVQPHRRDEMMAYLRCFDSVSEFESEVYRKDGTIIWVAENVRTIKDAEGKVLYYEGSVQNITGRRETEEELRQQRYQSEQLLLNILPQPIAERLKRHHATIADDFAEVTVLFADIANFTQLSSHISPIDLVELLNRIFSTFDKLADRYNLEKIKTIGDAYMVVGGLPKPMPDHVNAIARMALGIQREITQFRTPTNQPIQLRIGIDTGPVVAGVIGTKKFIYDLWGDTVNVASRMESQGEPGRIQVTEKVYERLKRHYCFAKRGEIEVKGKGWMPTYWLIDQQK